MIEKEIGSMEKIFIFLILFSLTFLQRFAIPIGSLQIAPVFLISLLASVTLFFFNRIEIHQKRFTIFLIAICGVFIASFYGFIYSKNVGLSSLLSLFLFYIPFLFISRQKGCLNYIFSTYQTFMLIIAVLGIFQFLLQFVGFGFIDPINNFPRGILLDFYNTQNPLSYGSPIMKANGMTMLEPSFYSKMLATGIIIEFLTKKRKKVIILYFIGMLLSFSGTGFIILLIAAIPILFKLKPLQVIFLVILMAIPVYFLFDKGLGNIFIQRLNEFNTPNTSGHVRFIAPWLAYKEFITFEDTETILFGTGSGTIEKYKGSEFTFNEMNPGGLAAAHPLAYVKLLIEYGIIGGLFFTIFIIYTFFSITQNKLLTVCLFINYSFLTGSLLQTTTIFICFILGTFAAENWKPEDVRKTQWVNNYSIQKARFHPGFTPKRSI